MAKVCHRPKSDTKAPCISQVAGRQNVSLLLEATGLGSHNACQRLISQGRVTVQGQVARHGSERADPFADDVRIDGEPLPLRNVCSYVLFSKPYDVLSSFTDRQGRATISDYVPVADVYAAGRLDYDSEGLMLLTSDGWLNHRLTHPRYDHPKTYWAQVERIPGVQALEALRRGVMIKGKRTRPATVTHLTGEREPQIAPRSVPIRFRKSVPTAWLEIVLREGRNRQVRRMTAAVGHPTLRLIRVALGPLRLGDLGAGQWRALTENELAALRRMLVNERRR